jgi:hypothetical protein
MISPVAWSLWSAGDWEKLDSGGRSGHVNPGARPGIAQIRYAS